jgi:hypothetical protein
MAPRRDPHEHEEFDGLGHPEDLEHAYDGAAGALDDGGDGQSDDDDDQQDEDDDRPQGGRDRAGRRGTGSRDGGRTGAANRQPWGARLILGFAALVVLATGTAITAAWLPRWWAEQVAGVVAGNTVTGVLAGLVCGLVGTAVPLLLLWVALRRRRTGARVAALVCALLVAVPDLTTLGIQVGGGRAASDGARILDLAAPAFRGATLAGAVLGVLVVVGLIWSRVTRRRHRRQIQQLRAQVRRQGDGGSGAPGDADPDDH